MFGGMMGLFDGANDVLENGPYIEPIMSFDGANDRADPLPAWDAVNGGYKYKQKGSTFGATGGHHDDRPAVVHPSVYGAEGQGDQLDGMNNINPQIFINGYGAGWDGRAVNDMDGDKYLGMTGDARKNLKRQVRLQGYPVSESAYGHQQNADHYQQAYTQEQPPYKAPKLPATTLWLGPQDYPTWRTDGNLTIRKAIVPPSSIPGALNELQKTYDILVSKHQEACQRLNAIPPGHPDADTLLHTIQTCEDRGDGIRRTMDRIAQVYNKFLLDQAVQNGQVNYVTAGGGADGGGGDLTAQRRAREHARFHGQAHQTSPVNNGFQQVGEGVTGGGAPNNQWQTPQKEPKAPSNAGWAGEQKNDAAGWADDKKDENAGGWAAGPQNNEPWGEERAKSERSRSRTPSHHSSNKSNGWGNNDNRSDGWNNNDNQQNSGDGAASQRGDQGNGGWVDQKSVSHKSNASQRNWGGGGQPSTPRSSASRGRSYDPTTPTPAPRKEYWTTWQQATTPHESSDPNTKKKCEEPRQPYLHPAPQLPAIPADKLKSADKKMPATHGVQPGKGAEYSHRCHRPNYMDEMTAPYAVFSFKYRSQARLKEIIKIDATADTQAVVAEAEMEKLRMMPKDRLIEEMMKLRTPNGGQAKARSSSGQKAASQSGGWGADNKSDAAATPGGVPASRTRRRRGRAPRTRAPRLLAGGATKTRRVTRAVTTVGPTTTTTTMALATTGTPRARAVRRSPAVIIGTRRTTTLGRPLVVGTMSPASGMAATTLSRRLRIRLPSSTAIRPG